MNEEINVPYEAETAETAQTAPFPAAEPARKPRVVALLNQKGGVGKTTSTVNLGAALARYGQRVLLIDLDPQSNLSLHFGVESGAEQRTIRDLLLDPTCGVEDCVQSARPGLDFIPAVTELALVEGELAQQEGMQSVLRSKLEPIYGNYDVVLLDCPPSLGVLSVNALTVADEVFVPMQAHYLPLRGLEKLLQTVHLVSQGLNPTIRVTGILLCMHDGSSSHAQAVIGEIEAQLAQFRATDVPWSAATVLDPPVRRNIKLAEAPSFGQTIFDYAPRCPGADDYRRIVKGLLERWELPHGEFEGSRPRATRDGEAAPKRRARRAAKPAKAGVSAKAAKKRPAGPKAAKPAKPAAKPPKPASKAAKAKRAKVAKGTTSAKPAKSVKSTKSEKTTKATRATKASKASKSPKPSKPSKPKRSAKTSAARARAGRSSARSASPRALRSGGLSL
jgi:chromosome partitioning protein